MRIPFLLLFCLGLAVQSISQTRLRVIRAGSTSVNIRADKTFFQNAWRIVPEQKPDVYATAAKRVTFYTDRDSISITVKPGKPYDFYILLNCKDSALTRVVYQPTRLDMLKTAKAYNPADTRPVPAFSYLSVDDARLAKIRKELKLDSIAGAGSEVSRFINLMHWVHNTIRHDGNSENPEARNALSIISVCRTEKRGVNCRMMATVLNECYLAMGFKSRYITCMPRELQFDDCHVINMVYSNDLQRWLWMDPTFDAYVMDEKGGLLGIREVRERLIDGRGLILNPDANWNRETSETREYYLETYMAKNLYRLECPVASTYDNETGIAGKKIAYIELLPLDALNQQPQHSENTNQGSGVIMSNYKTNNPELFWARP